MQEAYQQMQTPLIYQEPSARVCDMRLHRLWSLKFSNYANDHYYLHFTQKKKKKL